MNAKSLIVAGMNRAIAFSLVVLLIAGLSIIPPLYAQQSSANWNSVDGVYALNWNYSPQTQISKANVGNLEVKWIFPMPSAPPPYTGNSEGTIHTPLVINGIVYFVSNWHRLFAADARTGKILWFRDLPVNPDYCTYEDCPDWTPTLGHYHAIHYTETIRNRPLVWVASNDYHVFAVDALTGDLVINFREWSINDTIPGNFGKYDIGTPNIVIDEKTGILVGGTSVAEGQDAGRGYFMGYDITQTPPKLLWRTFIIPPQDGSDPEWSIKSVQNMSHAYIFDGKQAIDLKTLSPSQLHDMLYGDWGNFGFNGTHSFAGAGIAWGGSWAVDTETATVYVTTAQASPDWNATYRPGPNLWAESIMSLDERTGKINWAFKTIAHDLYDYDCSWNVVLARLQIKGQLQKAILKTCKNGVLYALDASTGALLWSFTPPSIKYSRSVKFLNPMNKTEMTKPWQNYPSTDAVVQNPPDVGGIESDMAYDPQRNLVFIAPYNAPIKIKVLPVGPGTLWNANYPINAGMNYVPEYTQYGNANTTIWAIDASTGIPKWSLFIPNVPYRGGLATTGGVVFATTNDGVLHIIDADTGKLIDEKLIGGPTVTQVAIAADTNGDVKLFIPSTAPFSSWGPVVPGFVAALGLSKAAAQAQTSTQILSQTKTLTEIVTVPGVETTILYIVSAIAVIFIVATVVLAVRRKTSG